MMPNRSQCLLAFLLVLGCGDGTGPASVAAVRIAAIRTVIHVGDSLSIAPSVVDAHGAVLPGRSVAWSSSDVRVVRIDERGVAFAVAPGSAVVRAAAGGKSDSATLTVTLVPVFSVKITPSAVTLGRNATRNIGVILRDSAGNVLPGRTVVWSSADSTIANVNYTDGTGMNASIAAYRSGATTIYATSEGVQGMLAVSVPSGSTVVAVEVRPDSLPLEIGESWALSVVLLDSAGNYARSGDPVAWSSSDTTVARVYPNGLVTAVGPGTAVVTATSAGQSGQSRVRVFAPQPTGALVIFPETLTVQVGGYASFSAQVVDSSGNRVFNRPVTWSTADGAIAQVVSSQSAFDATVRALAVGTTTVIASNGGKQGIATLRVTSVPVVASLTVDPSSATLVVGRSLVIHATARDASGTIVYSTVAWTTSDSSRAMVFGNGSATAIGPGAVVITATAGGRSATTTINVAPSVPLSLATVSTGWRDSCGLTTAGAAYCWGLNFFGARGDGTALDTVGNPVPARVSGGHEFAAITVGQFHVCGLTTQGAAYCWGANMRGQLGVGSPGPACVRYITRYDCSAVPVAVATDFTWSRITAGNSSSCALTTAHVAYCWGDNVSGQLGNGSTANANVPRAVAGDLHFTSIASGAAHTCALTASGQAYCWGSNWAGQVGAPTSETCSDVYTRTVGCSTVPLPVTGGLAFVSITAGGDHSCAITATGTAYCWGANGSGELGTGTRSLSDTPAPVSGGLHFTALSAGETHSCGITSSGAAYCWGSNSAGQLGSDTKIAFTATPVAVAGGRLFRSLNTGSTHSCGVSDSAAYCWGDNSVGELGTGNTMPNRAPGVAVTTP